MPHHPLRLATLALCAAALLGCDRLPDRADLVFLNGAEPQTIDPALMTGQPDGRVAYALFEGLLWNGPDGKPRAGTAERWDISEDGRIYTFHLRKDAKWSNGDPVTAHDFVASWRRALKPETASEYAYQLYYIRGAKDYNEGKNSDPGSVGIKALNDYQLEVTLNDPTPFFLDLCCFATLLPVHTRSVEECEKAGKAWTKPENMISNGAYTLKEWRLFDRIRLIKSETYWNKDAIGMKSIDILPSGRPMTAFNFYATGLADLMMDKGLAPTSLMGELKHRKDFHAAPFLGNYFMRFNCSRKPFNDVRVRMAFSLVIDKQLIVDKITRAGEVPAYSLTPPGTAGYEPPAGLNRDVEKARKLLAEAGYPGGKGFPIVYYLFKGDSDLDRDIGVELQGMFARDLGVNIQLEQKEWKVYLSSLSSLDYDICRSTWVGDYADPNTFMDMFVTDGGNNRTGWSSKAYDDAIAAAAKELDQAKRFEIFRQAEKLMISEEVPICPLYYYVGIQFYDAERLGGIEANVLDEHPLKAVYWKKR